MGSALPRSRTAQPRSRRDVNGALTSLYAMIIRARKAQHKVVHTACGVRLS